MITSAAGNTIGGAATGAGNLISGNDSLGAGDNVHITGTGASGNIVAGNYIGSDKTGNSYVLHNYVDVLLDGGASNNTIGGLTAGRA